jgi:hypothetical protein
MTRRDVVLALGNGALIAGLFVAVGAFQAYLVAQDWLHGQPGFLALQLTWAAAIPAGVLLAQLGRLLTVRTPGAGVIARAGALAGLLGSAGCVLANVLLQVVWRAHRQESYPGIMPAFVPESIVAVIAASALAGLVLSLGGMALVARRAHTAHATLA